MSGRALVAEYKKGGEFADWFAPDNAGDYIITVKVKGDHGRKGTASIIITVRQNHAPVIEDLVVTAGHRFLKDLEDYYKVGKDKTYHIKCQAWDVDDDSLVYTWSWDRGDIQGSGHMVTWIAPDVDCEVTITVTVLDGWGGVATQDLLLKVVRCSPCTFGS